MTISLAHNNLSLVHTHYKVHIPNCRTNNSRPTSNIQTPPTGSTPTENSILLNNPPNRYQKYQMTLIYTQDLHIPLRQTHLIHLIMVILNEHNTCVKNTRKSHNNYLIKKYTKLTYKLLNSAYN